GAEGRRKAEAQGALIAAVDIGPRAVDRERHPPDIADLGQVLDIDPVLGELVADRPEIFALRAELLGDVGKGAGLQSLELLLARRPADVAAVEGLEERRERRLRVG